MHSVSANAQSLLESCIEAEIIPKTTGTRTLLPGPAVPHHFDPCHRPDTVTMTSAPVETSLALCGPRLSHPAAGL